MNIRPANLKDTYTLATLHIDSWKSAYKGLVPDEFLAQLDYTMRADRFRESLKQSREETYVAEIDGELVGFLILGLCRDEDLDHNVYGEI
ncbi:MAG: hypothetical protein JW794_03075 [Candidatus Cloacimonetes bacterium]|nr:hypothetical protein [Candidatus Cloacimonadota bacterium]